MIEKLIGASYETGIFWMVMCGITLICGLFEIGFADYDEDDGGSILYIGFEISGMCFLIGIFFLAIWQIYELKQLL